VILFNWLGTVQLADCGACGRQSLAYASCAGATAVLRYLRHFPHRRSQGAQGTMPPQFLAYPVILFFEKRCLKQNTVARLKSNILSPPKFLAVYATGFPLRFDVLGVNVDRKVVAKKWFCFKSQAKCMDYSNQRQRTVALT